MSVTTRNPLRIGGTVNHSGGISTNELAVTRGGQFRFCAFSGGLRSLGSGTGGVIVSQAVDHAILWSGAGRINTVLVHQAISGVSLKFYDSAVAARSGPNTFTESGYTVIGIVPPNTWNPNGGTLLGIHPPIVLDVPFHSGLAVVGASGVPGFTVTWTPDVQPGNPG